MAYSYDPIFAVDPNSPSNVARNASILIFDPNDATKTPATLTDITGSPLANPVVVNQHGFGPAIQHETLDRLAWEGAGMSGLFTSYEGMKEEAVAARVAAQTAALEAGQAATDDIAARIAAGEFNGEKGADGSNVLPTDTAIKNAITTPGTETSAALKAAFVPGNPTLVVTYNGDGSVASTIEDGVLTTFTYNTDGTVNTQTRAGVTKTFTYDANGNVTGAA